MLEGPWEGVGWSVQCSKTPSMPNPLVGAAMLTGAPASLLSRCSGIPTASSPSCCRRYRMNPTR